MKFHKVYVLFSFCKKPTAMIYIYKLAALIASNMALIVVAVSAISLFVPKSFLWASTSAITPMLGVVMFGMGLTLRASDFKPVLMHPREIIIGELAQFIIMPVTAWLLCKCLHLPLELADVSPRVQLPQVDSTLYSEVIGPCGTATKNQQGKRRQCLS